MHTRNLTPRLCARAAMLRPGIPLLALAFFLALAGRAQAGPLRLLAPGGADTALLGAPTFSQSDVDFQHPAALPDLARNRMYFTREFETDFYEKENGRVLNLDTSKSRSAGLLYHVRPRGKFRTTLAAETYGADTKLFTNDAIQNTQLYANGKGGAVALAGEFKSVRLGVYKTITRDTVTGASEEAVNRVEVLDPDAAVLGYWKMERQGVEIRARISKRLSVGWSDANEKITALVEFADTDDDFRIPARITGPHRAWQATWNSGGKYSITADFHNASYGSLDDIFSGAATQIGRWKSSAGYDLRALTLFKSGSPRHMSLFGYEDYRGSFQMAGAMDLLGSTANLLSGYYLVHAGGTLNRRTFRYAARWTKGNYTWKCRYAYTTGRAFVHYDAQRSGLAVLLGFAPANAVTKDKHYKYTQHLLGLGVEKPIARDTVLQYTLIEVIPLIKEIGKLKTAAPTQATRTVRGGTLHILTVNFYFE